MQDKQDKPLWRTLSFLERLKRQTKIGAGGCVIWLGWREPRGYGRVRYRGRKELTHRAVYRFFVGRIPRGFQIHHKCHNPSCVNPRHLKLVTHAEHCRLGRHVTKTVCKNGHKLVHGNLLHSAKPGRRLCRLCWMLSSVRYLRKEIARANATFKVF